MAATSPRRSTSPGWKKDPQDPSLLRYWDGSQWGERTVPRAFASTVKSDAPAAERRSPGVAAQRWPTPEGGEPGEAGPVSAEGLNSPGAKWVTDRYLWWDGQRYTASWDGTSWTFIDASRPRRPRRGWVIALVVGGCILGGVLALIGLDEALTHDLLSADFSATDDTFATGETDEYEIDVDEGSYRLTSTSPPTGPLVTYGYFARTAYNVEIEASVISVDATDAMVGVECAHTVTGSDSGYVFGYDPTDGYAIYEVSGGEAELLARSRGIPPEAGTRIGINCDGASIVGLVDGSEVVRANDSSYDSFEAACLIFWPTDAYESIRFDDVTAIVPGH